jgi:LDH2 family malate/lactate/ureidoglycolate dehydrogenase
MTDTQIRIKWQSLKAFMKELFLRLGMSPEDAEIEAEVLIWANLRGVDSHGALLLPWYVDNLTTGVMNPKPDIKIEKETPATILIEADRSLGAPVTVFAMKRVMEKAKKVGVGWGIIRNVTHQGAIGYYSLMAAQAGMAGLTFTCNPPNMAPYGAKAPGVHNSPIAISVPAKRHRALLLDMATSVVAAGKINLAVDKNVPIPQGWALDKDGNPTTDPRQAVILLPFGGAKGSGLAMMFECLSGVMSGNPLLSPALLGTDAAAAKPSEPKPRPGHASRHIQNSVVAAINIGTFTDVESYKEHIDNLIDGIKALPKAEGVSEIFVPGEPEWRPYDERSKNGIPLPDGTVQNLRHVADRVKINLPEGL